MLMAGWEVRIGKNCDRGLENAALRATNSQTNSHNFKNSIEFTYSYFPCHLKVNRDKPALISRLWKCKNGERLTITANSFTKIVDYRSTRRIPPAVAVRMRKLRPFQEPIRLQEFLNSARSRAEKRINIQLFLQRLSHTSVKAYATMPIGIMGRTSLALID